MREFICIICPRGCNLKVTEDLVVSGNSCKRGLEYALSEVKNPVRSLTTTVKVQSSLIKRLPVKTSKPIPKDKLFLVMEYLDQIEVKAPIQFNAVIVKNILGLNSDIIATRKLEK